MTPIMLCCFLSPNNWISASSAAAGLMSDQVDEGENSFTYYSSIFSNLSRGLPIDESDPSSVPPNEQQEDDQDFSSNSTG